jgi:hypothetical protein
MNKKINKTILCLYPNSFGVCYAVFDSPKDLVDYGVGYVRPVSNSKSFNKVNRYLDYYNPDIVLVRALTNPNSKMNKRNKKLIDLICERAKKKGLRVHQYTRGQVKDVFSLFNVVSKYQISKKIIEWFPVLEGVEYPYRKEWMNENHFVGVFDSISLGIVYYYLNDFSYGD